MSLTADAAATYDKLDCLSILGWSTIMPLIISSLVKLSCDFVGTLGRTDL